MIPCKFSCIFSQGTASTAGLQGGKGVISDVKTLSGTVSMVQGRILYLSRLLLPLICICLLSGFTMPSPHELRREFAAELKRIRESTPGARALASWQQLRDQAGRALEKAEINGAPEFAPEEFEEASDLFRRARAYAAERSYRKASYLAKKTEEIARLASENALAAREKIEKKLNQQLVRLKARLDILHSRLPFESNLSVQLADLYLQWADIRHCIALGLYDQAEKQLHVLKMAVNEFRRQSGIHLDDQQEKWEETI